VVRPLSFFFSSRRRHTMFSRDWSSDVCSSDLGFALERRAALAAPAGFRRRLPSGLPCTARTYIHTSIRDKEPVFAALTGRPVIRVPAKPNCLTVDGGAKLRLHPTAFGLVLWVRHVFPYGPVPVQEITCPVRGSNNSDTSHTSPPPPPQASV